MKNEKAFLKKSESNLECLLAEGHFAVTVEIGPPMDCNAEIVLEKARLLKGLADAFNIKDRSTRQETDFTWC